MAAALIKTSDEDFEDFMKESSLQLDHIQFPAELTGTLHAKLHGSVFDAGSSFIFEEDEAAETETCEALKLLASKDLCAGCDVWIIDHVRNRINYF